MAAVTPNSTAPTSKPNKIQSLFSSLTQMSKTALKTAIAFELDYLELSTPRGTTTTTNNKKDEDKPQTLPPPKNQTEPHPAPRDPSSPRTPAPNRHAPSIRQIPTPDRFRPPLLGARSRD